jgi:hypothetical protein
MGMISFLKSNKELLKTENVEVVEIVETKEETKVEETVKEEVKEETSEKKATKKGDK